MITIRIIFVDNTYKDILCTGVKLNPQLLIATVIGGEEDGKVYYRATGARVIKGTLKRVPEQLRLFNPDEILREDKE